MWSHSGGTGVKTSTYECCGDTVQPRTTMKIKSMTAYYLRYCPGTVKKELQVMMDEKGHCKQDGQRSSLLKQHLNWRNEEKGMRPRNIWGRDEGVFQAKGMVLHVEGEVPRGNVAGMESVPR